MLRDTEFMVDMIESARIALDHIGGKSRDEFLKDVKCQDAVIRRLEVIGESARRISEETREFYPTLPWSEMINMRNLMIHEYDDIDLGIVYETVVKDIPPLIAALEAILA